MSLHIAAGGVFDERLQCWRLLIEQYDPETNHRSGHLDKRRYKDKPTVDIAAQLFIQNVNAQAQAAQMKLQSNGHIDTPNEGDAIGADSEGE